MRDIEFRGKDFAGFWHHGFLSGALEECAEILEELSGRKICTMVLKETVGQYTGQTDKNGRKIFEGDIIHVISQNANGNFEVKYKYGQFCIGISTPICHIIKSCKVIGNIHDKPELLEGVV